MNNLIGSNEISKKYYYDDISGKAENKVISINKNLEVDKVTFVSSAKYKIIYYDTPDKLLTKSGVLLSKSQENGEYVLKVERLNFLPSVSRGHDYEAYVHKINPKDEPKHHSFYLINGITDLFSTIFTIDLEYIIKKVVPIYTIDVESSVYRAFKSNGFKCLLSFEKLTYVNTKNKRKKVNNELVVSYSGHQNFYPDLKRFIVQLERYCKDILEKDLTRFEYASKVTKDIVKQPKEKKKKKKEVVKIQG